MKLSIIFLLLSLSVFSRNITHNYSNVNLGEGIGGDIGFTFDGNSRLYFSTLNSQVMVFDGANTYPVPRLFEDLFNVVITPSLSDVLSYDGTNWVNSNSVVLQSVDSLSYTGGSITLSGNVSSGSLSTGEAVSTSLSTGATTTTTLVSTNITADSIDVSSTTSASRPCPVMTETQRDLLTGLTGQCVYNSTTGKIQNYNGTSWEDIGLAGNVDNSAGVPIRVESCRVNNNGVATVDTSSGLCSGWVSSVTRTAPGLIQIDFVSSTFSAEPVCTFVNFNNEAVVTGFIQLISSTSVTTRTLNTVDANADMHVFITCVGKK